MPTRSRNETLLCAAAPLAAGPRRLQSPARQNAKIHLRCVSREGIAAPSAPGALAFLPLRLPPAWAGRPRRPCAFSLRQKRAPCHRSRPDRSRLSFPPKRNSAPPSCIHGAANTNTRTSRREFRCDAPAVSVNFRGIALARFAEPFAGGKVHDCKHQARNHRKILETSWFVPLR